MAFNIQTTVEIQKGILEEGDTFVPTEQSGTVTVIGSLSGEPGREIELVANEASGLGYQFKKWIIETIPVTKTEVATSMPYTTYDEICAAGRENTAVSVSYFSDGKFLYEDQEGNRVAPAGFYGIGGGRYYIHDTSVGLRGPLVCGQSNNTGGGGSNPAQSTGGTITTSGGSAATAGGITDSIFLIDGGATAI